MNFHMQKLLNLNKRKAEQADNLISRCIELEKNNQRLLTLINEGALKTNNNSERKQQQDSLVGGKRQT